MVEPAFQKPGARTPHRGKDAEAFSRSLRAVRLQRQLSQSELARRLGLSAGMISQLEKGLSLPSVSTMLAIAAELETSLDSLFGAPVTPEYPPDEARDGTSRPVSSLHLSDSSAGSASAPTAILSRLRADSDPVTESRGIEGLVQRAPSRSTLRLEDGVTWELLTTDTSHRVLFVMVTYPAGAATTAENTFVRHPDFEYFLMLEGELDVSVEFEHTRVAAGDSMWFDSTRPHYFQNNGTTSARGVWFITPQESS